MRIMLVLVASLSQTASIGIPFRPWAPNGYRIVNAMAFSPDGGRMYVALFPADIAKAAGVAVGASAPEVALYESERSGGGWSAPRLMPFAGTYQDYEPAVAPDGSFMIFNSQRPLPDGTPIKDRKNNLWLTRRTADGWSSPVYLKGINRLDSEESYASITRDGRVVYLREGASDANGPDYDIHVARLAGDDLVDSAPLAPAATSLGEADPWIAPDGSYVIFTRWDRSKKWEEDVDLYIAFFRDGRWSTPQPLTELSAPGRAEYGVTISGDTIYWKAGGTTMSTAWAPILEAALRRAQ